MPAADTPAADTPANTPASRRKPLAFDANINITPEYLLFPPPHTGRSIQNTIYLYNTANTPCVYKLRSQNPNRYVAKPNVAIIAPKTATRIKVTLCMRKDEGTISPETQERFRISVKALTKPPAQSSSTRLPTDQWYATADAKDVWNTTKDPITHEKDIIAYFNPQMPTPPGGMVSFLPESYASPNRAASKGRGSGSSSNRAAARHEDPMSQLPSDRRTTPARTGASSGETPQASRQLNADLEDAAAAAATKPTDKVTATGSSLAQKKAKKGRRTWVTFLRAAVIAMVLAYGVGVVFRLYADGPLELGDGEHKTQATVAAAEPAHAQVEEVQPEHHEHHEPVEVVDVPVHAHESEAEQPPPPQHHEQQQEQQHVEEQHFEEPQQA